MRFMCSALAIWARRGFVGGAIGRRPEGEGAGGATTGGGGSCRALRKAILKAIFIDRFHFKEYFMIIKTHHLRIVEGLLHLVALAHLHQEDDLLLEKEIS